eukprot:scaffold14887_cov123-Isochrysis_galbana.AAC.6
MHAILSGSGSGRGVDADYGQARSGNGSSRPAIGGAFRTHVPRTTYGGSTIRVTLHPESQNRHREKNQGASLPDLQSSTAMGEDLDRSLRRPCCPPRLHVRDVSGASSTNPRPSSSTMRSIFPCLPAPCPRKTW